jgi:tape measure domain-containing protein
VAERLGEVELKVSLDSREALLGLDQTKRAAMATGDAIKGILEVAGFSLGAAALIGYAKSVSSIGIAAEAASTRLSSLAGRFGESEQAQQSAAEAARLLNLTQTEAASGFAQLFAALRPVGVGLQDIETIFIGVTAAAKNTGLGAESVNNALIQLTQGLASGRLQGDELRSVLEQLPPLSQAIANQMKVRVGDLKLLGSEGKITADIIIKALQQLKSQEVGQLSKSLNTSQEKLKALSVEAQNFQKELSTAFGAPALGVVSALTQAFKELAGAIRAANIANQNQKLTLQADKQAGDLVQQKIGPFGGSGFFGGVSVNYKGKTYKGTATGVKNDLAKAILNDLINDLTKQGGGSGSKPTPTAAPVANKQLESAMAASKKRLDNLVRVQGLEGDVLNIVQAQYAVQDNIAESARLQSELSKAESAARSAGKKPGEDQASVDAATRLTAATNNLASAQLELANIEERVNKQRTESLKAINDGIASAELRMKSPPGVAALREQVAQIEKLKKDEASKSGLVGRLDAISKGFGSKGDDPYTKEAKFMLEEAGLNLRLAMINGAQVAADTLKTAGDSLKSALAAQNNARVAAFDLITPQAQQQVRDRLIGTIQEGVGAGQLDPNKVTQLYGRDLSKVDIAQLADLAGKSASLIDAQKSVADASKTFAEATTTLAAINQQLVAKDWMVRVNVASDGQAAVSGAILGG